MMHIALFLVAQLASLLPLAAADWTTTQWDAIVVGAGPAGIIVATRLAEANLNTLLLEGGGPSYGVTGGDLSSRRPSWLNNTDLTRVDVPGLYTSIFGDGGGLICSGTINAYGGCTIGGGSAINAGLYFEPPASDWDSFFPIGWRAADVDGAIERVKARSPSTDTPSADGIQYLQSGYDVVRRWIVDSLGFADVKINESNDNKHDVFGRPVYGYEHGQRAGPVPTYLQDALKLPNFHLQSGTRAVRVQRTGNAATGVWVLINGVETLIPLSNTGRVVISAGAIATPGFLMFSGIGPAAELTRLSAAGKLGNLTQEDWISNDAVGANLFDNPNTFIELSSPSITAFSPSYDNPAPADSALYLDHRSGPYASAGQTSVFFSRASQPDGRIVGFQGTIGTGGYADFTSNTTITLNIYGTSGLASRGAVVLDGSFIPGPDGNVYYSAPPDASAIAGFIARIFAALPADVQTLNLERNASVARIEQYITTPSAYARGQVNHWSGSCKIGACVDEAGRVVGTGNVWVADASLLEPLSVNPMFGVMTVGEKVAELILKGVGA
ncbi:hypothetical protein V496_06654 [Pseudogymnoascus sp. VKM F-4515 (FW-2607)]|nr:hypothetical protein V496_06654 [Pseudogymnoascus sp. VKM F-4515 (FW-2607)]KFY89658.1 hypothetical protein V498_06357 [Pseudogymnoascus sp. VKM F-4517 (FW-2822)]